MAHKGEHKYRLATAHMALLCENGQGKKLACAAANRFSLPFVSLRYNTSAPHDGRRGNSDGRTAEVRKPEEKDRVFDAADSTCNSPGM